MNAVASLVLIVLMNLVGSDAFIAVIKSGKCPSVPGQATLNASRYLGKWYEYKRFPAIFEAGQQCTSAEYGLTSDNKISVFNQGYLRVTVFGRRYVIKKESIRGNATVPDPAKPAELSVTFFGDFGGGSPNYFIQETDYDNYSVIFSCAQLPGFNVQFAWILTRQRGVAPANLADLEARLAAAGVDVSEFILVNQDQCPSE